MAADDQPLDQAISDVLARHVDGMVTGFYLIAEYITPDGGSAMVVDWPDGQRMSTTLGLLAWARGVAEYEQRRFLEETAGGDA